MNTHSPTEAVNLNCRRLLSAVDRRIVVAAAALLIGTALPLHGAQAHQLKGIDAGADRATSRETVTVAADSPIPNLPGKRLVSLIVEYPPGGSSDPHRHARSAFIYAYVLSGEIRSAVDGEAARVYRPGESWFESPGAHHRVSANASDTAPARLLAVFVVDAADEVLTTPAPR